MVDELVLSVVLVVLVRVEFLIVEKVGLFVEDELGLVVVTLFFIDDELGLLVVVVTFVNLEVVEPETFVVVGLPIFVPFVHPSWVYLVTV